MEFKVLAKSYAPLRQNFSAQNGNENLNIAHLHLTIAQKWRLQRASKTLPTLRLASCRIRIRYIRFNREESVDAPSPHSCHARGPGVSAGRHRLKVGKVL